MQTNVIDTELCNDNMTTGLYRKAEILGYKTFLNEELTFVKTHNISFTPEI